MGLEEYRKKRDFSRTQEPSGELPESFCSEIEKKLKGKIPKRKKPLYMVHDHRSKSRHFDLRLEMDGALKSWAIPKLIGMKNPYQRRLAIETEDHPIEYGYWEGKIPEGNYGAGDVKIWDSGGFEVLDFKPGKKLVFRVEGKRLRGIFVLIHFRPGKEWLFFRKKE